tara:strand:- start:543 stop:1784 length:1242 start_codon:yes stop_codon:yes gene_type:complete
MSTSTKYRLAPKEQGRSIELDLDVAPSLPDAPLSTNVLGHITFNTCPGSSLSITCIRATPGGVDAKGVHTDSWWSIECTDLPTRFLRLKAGSISLYNLLLRYGFVDNKDCVNHRSCTLHYTKAITPKGLGVHNSYQDVTGVPQFYTNSGVCWFASFCWVAFGNEKVAKFIIDRHPEALREYARQCLYSRKAAEAYRKSLWYDHCIGDDVDKHPLNDGQNGGSEFVTMCAKFHIPIIRLSETNGIMHPMPSSILCKDKVRVNVPLPCVGKPHILMLRFTDGDHAKKMPLHRRVYYCGVRYRLFAMFLGQRKCGHQCALVCCGDDWKRWGMTDADAHTHGIGPCFCEFKGDMSSTWWEKWQHIVNLTKFGKGLGEFCPMGPWNVNDHHYDKSKGSNPGTPGSNSVDAMYFASGDV